MILSIPWAEYCELYKKEKRAGEKPWINVWGRGQLMADLGGLQWGCPRSLCLLPTGFPLPRSHLISCSWGGKGKVTLQNLSKRDREITRSYQGTRSSHSHLNCMLGHSFPGGPLYVRAILKGCRKCHMPLHYGSYWGLPLLVHRDQPWTMVHPIPWRPIIWTFCRKKRKTVFRTHTHTNT